MASPSALPSELDLVREARIALRDDPRRALTTLDEHANLFPRGELREEAAALRAEALVRAGDVARARAEAARFAEAYPRSAYGERVRSVVRSQ